LSEERLEIQVWVTHQKDATNIRPRTRDKLIGSAYLDLTSLADLRRRQHRIRCVAELSYCEVLFSQHHHCHQVCKKIVEQWKQAITQCRTQNNLIQMLVGNRAVHLSLVTWFISELSCSKIDRLNGSENCCKWALHCHLNTYLLWSLWLDQHIHLLLHCCIKQKWPLTSDSWC